MALINVRELISDPDFASPYTVIRTKGEWVRSRFVLRGPVRLNFFGPVQPATEKELEQLPEGDLASGVMKFICSPPRTLYITQEVRGPMDEAYVSDMIVYGGDVYKLIKVKDWRPSGYIRAFGQRIGTEKEVFGDG